ncbi:MAG: hypothetical protein QXR58_01800 [Candidatus Micrarchaeaceae archaeon]
MPFRDLIIADLKMGKLGKSQYIMSYKPRQHISLSKMAEHDEIKYVEIGAQTQSRYASPIDTRYLGFKGISYDLVLMLYEINSHSAFASRQYIWQENLDKSVSSFLHSLKGVKSPEVEARIIGLQNSQDTSALSKLLDLLSSKKIEVYEADLFGNELRHIALDMHTGTTFNILLLDRLYRPGELLNKLTEEQFQRGIQPSSPSQQVSKS